MTSNKRRVSSTRCTISNSDQIKCRPPISVAPKNAALIRNLSITVAELKCLYNKCTNNETMGAVVLKKQLFFYLVNVFMRNIYGIKLRSSFQAILLSLMSHRRVQFLIL